MNFKNLKVGQTRVIAKVKYKKVPKLNQLWTYSDEFSEEINEKARKAALKEIREIEEYNNKLKLSQKEDRKKVTKVSKKIQPEDMDWFNAALKDVATQMSKELKAATKSEDALYDSYFWGYSNLEGDRIETVEQAKKLDKNNKKFRQWILDTFFSTDGHLSILRGLSDQESPKLKKYQKNIAKLKDKTGVTDLRTLDKIIDKSLKSTFKIR